MTDPYMIRAHVPDFQAIFEQYQADSERSRAAHRTRADVSYGVSQRERLDIFWPAEGGNALPIHIFIHGGYWRAQAKADYSYIADAVLAAGAIAVIVDYDLMPGSRMPTLIGEVRRGARWVRDNAVALGGDPRRITASGHSAGAHLASYLVNRGPHEPDWPTTGVSGLLLLSGIYDLAPIAQSFLQPELGLTAAELAEWSPVSAVIPPGFSAVLAVGGDETPPFHRDAATFAAAARRAGGTADQAILPDENHMTIVRSLGRPDTDCAAPLRRLIG